MKIKPSLPKISPNGHCTIKLKKAEVDISDIEETARKMKFSKQTSRHISVIAGRTEDALYKILSRLNVEERKKLVSQIESLINQFDWMSSPQRVAYHIKKRGTFGKESRIIENRESVVRLIDMPDMKRFFNKLNQLLGTKFPPHFPHITLFTKGDRSNATWRGIGIPSEEEFKKLNPRKFIELHKFSRPPIAYRETMKKIETCKK